MLQSKGHTSPPQSRRIALSLHSRRKNEFTVRTSRPILSLSADEYSVRADILSFDDSRRLLLLPGFFFSFQDNEIAKLRAQLKKIPVSRIRAKTESQQRIIPTGQRRDDLCAKSSALVLKPSRKRRTSSPTPHESHPSLKLRIRTSRIRYVESTSDDECRSEDSNELRDGNERSNDDEIVLEVVRSLVIDVISRS